MKGVAALYRVPGLCRKEATASSNALATGAKARSASCAARTLRESAAVWSLLHTKRYTSPSWSQS